MLFCGILRKEGYCIFMKEDKGKSKISHPNVYYNSFWALMLRQLKFQKCNTILWNIFKKLLSLVFRKSSSLPYRMFLLKFVLSLWTNHNLTSTMLWYKILYNMYLIIKGKSSCTRGYRKGMVVTSDKLIKPA